MNQIPLSDVLSDLRRELTKAQDDGADEKLKFLVEDVEIELQLGTTQKGTGKGSVKFYVLNLESGGEVSHSATQKLRLKLKVVDKQGNQVSFSGQDDAP